jgi:redox-sensitive bicupin YhaK (pirin superfamily)
MSSTMSQVDLVHGSSISFQHPGLKHRAGAPLFKYLLSGTDDDFLNNYNLVISRQQSFYSPRHKHNFEQFRLPLSGSFSIGTESVPEVVLHEGELGYFPEGVEYGPQQDGDEIKEILVLQFSGPCKQGYISWDRLKKVQASLEGAEGKFEGGKFITDAGAKDGFEVLWETEMQRKLVYPIGRFREPVIMKLSAFGWEQTADRAWKKLLGVFSGTTAEVLKVENGGAIKLEGEEGTVRLFYVLAGSGQVDKSIVEKESAFRLRAGEVLTLTSKSIVEILGIYLPLYCE